MRSALAVLAALLFATMASAEEGVLEINQTCAVQTGCFDGDAPGFPVTINVSGSYALTGNLSIPNVEISGIQIAASDVDLDLRGFAISGTSGCVEGPGLTAALCPEPAAGVGIKVESESVAIKNGTIRGMGGNGISVIGGSPVARGTRIERVRALFNRGDGIKVDDRCLVSDSILMANGLAGVRTGWWCVVENNTSSANALQGIATASESVIRGNTVARNGYTGIDANENCLIANNVVGESGNYGIFADVNCRVVGNVVRNSASIGIYAAETGHLVEHNAVSGSGGDGIFVGTGSSVNENTIEANTGFALRMGAKTAYRSNTIVTSANAEGSVVGGVNAGGNVCNGSMACP